MSHREKSLTPWLGRPDPNVTPNVWDEVAGRWSDDDPKTDREKHDFCLRRTGHPATIIPPAMYDRASEFKCDMRWYVKNQPIVIEHSEKYCGGITCMPGLGGKCVACSEDD